ncbi:MAG: nucleotidyl transferase AbiEii/AbiGii toxin family protein [Acidobacteria bacterium]|nr:nucleotidyl transferase AbiEii/AbiGii toxin family protein [Acidobacteriota bacterium]
MIDHLEQYVRTVARHLHGLDVDFAVVGGIAVSLRTTERFTKDVDFAISVDSDADAEVIVDSLRKADFRIAMFLEREDDGKLMTVRLNSGGDVEVFVDLLFATSGIEKEIVDSSTPFEVFPGLVTKLATISSLIAMKVLSANWESRPQDILDLQYLIKDATDDEIAQARSLTNLITARGYNRNKDLQAELDKYLAQFRS